MKKRQGFILGIIFLIVVVAALSIKNNRKSDKVCYKDNCFEVELAVTPQEQQNGLMFRKKLDANRGILFIFQEEGMHSFWMKNTLIPLDIIWMNEKMEIIFISGNTAPCREDFCPMIGPDKKAKYVLEINGGEAKKLGMKIGDKMEIRIRKDGLQNIGF